MPASREADLRTLRHVPLFSHMDDDEIAGILSIMDVDTFAPGQVVSAEDDEGLFFYVVVEGRVQFFVQAADGVELMVDEVGPCGFFGELAMLTGEKRLARARAVDEVRTLALDRDEFFQFLEQHPPAALDVLTAVAERLHRNEIVLQTTASRNVNVVSDQTMTPGMKIADGFAAVMGSWGFIIVQSVLLIAWVTANALGYGHWDPYPFILLNLALSFQAAYAAPIIMMSQNRQSDKDRLAAEIDHDVNNKAETEIGLVLQRLDDIERGMHHHHREQCELLVIKSEG